MPRAITRRRLTPWAAVLVLLSLSACDGLFGPDPRSPASITIVDGDAQAGIVGEPLDLPFRVEVRDHEGRPAAGATVAWTASAGSIVRETLTDSLGIASALLTLGEDAGAHTVRASVEGVSELVFEAVAVAGAAAEITIAPDSVLLDAIGDTVALAVDARDRFGNEVDAALLEWSSSDAAVAAVDPAGRVASRGAGRAEITVAAGEAAAAATVVVAQRVVALALGPAPDTLRELGETARVPVTATDANGFEVASPALSWESRNDAIAAIDGTGAVTARGRGTARIVASAGDVSDSLTLAVIPWGRVTVSMELNRWEIFDIVFPIMERHGLTGNLEIVVMYIGDPDRLTVEEIETMHDAGWAVVPHTITLPHLPGLTMEELREEVLGSQAWVRDRGFRGSSIFIVPGHNAGDRELELIRDNFSAARTRGYLHVRTMTDWPDGDPYGIVGLEGEGFLDSAELRAEMAGIWRDAIHGGHLLEIYFHRVKSGQARGFEAFIRELAEYREFVATFAELFEE